LHKRSDSGTDPANISSTIVINNTKYPNKRYLEIPLNKDITTLHKLLPQPRIIVSYADTSVGHVGFVYQACNFIYTGLSSKFTDPKVKGLEHQHHATYANGKSKKMLEDEYGNRLYWVQRPRKHRYVIFVANKTDRKKMRAALKYTVAPYPKGKTQITGNPESSPLLLQLPLVA
jgi:hypothetical protein